MPAKTTISWTDYSTNPFKAQRADGKTFNYCIKISSGCANCYAATLTHRWGGPEYMVKGGEGLRPVYNHEEHRKLLTFIPRPPFRRTTTEGRDGWLSNEGPMIFAHDMTDAFLEFWPTEFLTLFFAAVEQRQEFIFQILTKRPERMLEFFADRPVLPNLWLGVSVENQETADRRIPVLLKVPAAVRFISYEPALGPVDFSAYFGGEYVGLPGDAVHPNYNFGISWLICGGESGPCARQCDLAWIRSAVEQCRAAGVPVWVKQDSGPQPGRQGRIPDELFIQEFPKP